MPLITTLLPATAPLTTLRSAIYEKLGPLILAPQALRVRQGPRSEATFRCRLPRTALEAHR